MGFLISSSFRTRSDLPLTYRRLRLICVSGSKRKPTQRICKYGTHGNHFSPNITSTIGYPTAAMPIKTGVRMNNGAHNNLRYVLTSLSLSSCI